MTPSPSLPAQLPGTLHSSVATAGIRLYLESPEVVVRDSGFRVRLIISNEGSAPVHFDDTGRRVWVTRKVMADSVEVDDFMRIGRSARPLDLGPGASTVETLALDSSSVRVLAEGLHDVRAWEQMEPHAAAPSVKLTVQTEPLPASFR